MRLPLYYWLGTVSVIPATLLMVSRPATERLLFMLFVCGALPLTFLLRGRTTATSETSMAKKLSNSIENTTLTCLENTPLSQVEDILLRLGYLIWTQPCGKGDFLLVSGSKTGSKNSVYIIVTKRPDKS